MHGIFHACMIVGTDVDGDHVGFSLKCNSPKLKELKKISNKASS